MKKKITALFLAGMFVVILFSYAIPAERSAGNVIDDSTITSKVKAKLLADSITKGLAVSVKTVDGEVTLTGAVDTDEQKKTAETIAREVDGVKKVNNQLKIKKA